MLTFKKPKALAGGLCTMAFLAVWSIGSGWLVEQPVDLLIVSIIIWLSVTALMIMLNVF